MFIRNVVGWSDSHHSQLGARNRLITLQKTDGNICRSGSQYSRTKGLHPTDPETISPAPLEIFPTPTKRKIFEPENLFCLNFPSISLFNFNFGSSFYFPFLLLNFSFSIFRISPLVLLSIFTFFPPPPPTGEVIFQYKDPCSRMKETVQI
jgi:hypothetical protein